MIDLFRWSLPVVLVVLSFAVNFANCSSYFPPPLRSVSRSSTRSIRIKRHEQPRIVPREKRWDDHLLSHDDTFLLETHVDDQTVFLLLRPTPDLIHQDAKLVYHDGVQHVYEPVHRHDHLAYSGIVLNPDEVERYWAEEIAGLIRPSQERLHRPWASAYLHDSQGLEWEGSFLFNGDIHSVKTVKNYHLTKHPHDPHVDDYDANLLAANFKRDLSSSTPHLVTYRHSNIVQEQNDSNQQQKRSSSSSSSPSSLSSCAHDQLSFNSDPFHPVFEAARKSSFDHHLARKPTMFDHLAGRDPQLFNPFIEKRQSGDAVGGMNVSTNFIDDIGSTSGCPSDARVVYIGLAADCEYVSKYTDRNNTRTTLLQNLNSASTLYANTFNVRLGAVEIYVVDPSCPSSTNSSEAWNQACESDGGPDLNTRLSYFSQWRGDKGASDGAGLWHLLSNCPSGSEVGVAWLGQLCQTEASGSGSQVTSGTGVSASSRNEWQVMAHEIGHNFGAIHDCESGCTLSQNCCPLSRSTCNADDNYIMAPVSNQGVSNFSDCSVGNICTMIGSNLDTSCLATPGDRTVISLQQCGNGIVEPGEECDPGSNSTSTCCDSSTCKLRDNAQCDPTNSACCTDQCSFRPSGFVCRSSIDDDCDREETCTGDSGECPDDEHVSDGTSCGSGLYCASGHCTSRDQQCRQQGTSLNLEKSCTSSTDSSCLVTCQDPRSSNSCIRLDTNFIDGTPCGYGGKCDNGNCKSGSPWEVFTSWYRQNLQIAIPVTVVVGLLVLLIIWRLLVCIFRKARGQPAFKRKNGAPGGAAASYMPVGRRKRLRGQQRIDSDPSIMASRSYGNAPPPQHPYNQPEPPTSPTGREDEPLFAPTHPQQPPYGFAPPPPPPVGAYQPPPMSQAYPSQPPAYFRP